MLVPHEPEDDPRIRWVTSLCAEVGRTEILGLTISTKNQAREYDGLTYTERVNLHEKASTLSKAAAVTLGGLGAAGPTRRYVTREGRHPRETAPSGASTIRTMMSTTDHHLGSVFRLMSAWGWYSMLVSALYRRGRAVSIPPRVIVCHDLYALLAAIRLKRLFGCPVIYDSHEFWPEADLLGQPWEARLLARVEKALVRRADIVITVSPQLAQHLEMLYGLRRVLCVPNAEPFVERGPAAPERATSWPVRFLFQGQATPGRGIDELLKTWLTLDDERAVLYLRCPDNAYLDRLRGQYRDAIARQRIVVLPPGRSDDLVALASFADVGVIPYAGSTLNHVYACPNKLSQYMQAGLAILSNRLEFVSEVVHRYGCGVIYDANNPDSLSASVRSIVDDLDRLQQMRRNAYDATKAEFNWRIQSRPYAEAIRDLFSGVVT